MPSVRQIVRQDMLRVARMPLVEVDREELEVAPAPARAAASARRAARSCPCRPTGTPSRGRRRGSCRSRRSPRPPGGAGAWRACSPRSAASDRSRARVTSMTLRPPSTAMICPVDVGRVGHEERTARAMSSGSPTRLSSECSRMRWRDGFVLPLARPRATGSRRAQRRSPAPPGPSSRASGRVSAASPPFADAVDDVVLERDLGVDVDDVDDRAARSRAGAAPPPARGTAAP